MAASTDKTGTSGLGGNWQLESATGAIETGVALTAAEMDAYATTLVTNTIDFSADVVTDYVVSTTATTNFGSVVVRVVGNANSTATARASLSDASDGEVIGTDADFYYRLGSDGDYLVIYTDGREVSFQSVGFGSDNGQTFTSLTAYAYRDGTLLGSQTVTRAFPNDITTATATFTDAIFQSVDEIRLQGHNDYAGGSNDVINTVIDNLVIGDPVLPGPTVTVVVTDTALRLGETSLVTFTFSEAVSGFDNADITIPNGTLSAVSSSDGGTIWTATFTPTAGVTDATNVISVNMAGVASAATSTAGSGTTNSNNYAIDTQRPTATIVVSDTALAAGETSLVTFTFNEAVTGFTNADLTIANGTLTSVSSSDGGITWTATLTPTASTSDATNLITLDNTGVADLAGNFGTGTTDSNNYAIDTVSPTLDAGSSTPADEASNVAIDSNIVIDFSENIAFGSSGNIITLRNVTTNSTVETFSSAGGSATGTASISGDKLTLNPNADLLPGNNYSVQFAAAALVDDAGNPLAAIANETSYNFSTVSANAVPVFANLNGGGTFTEGGSAVVLDGVVTVSDTELDALSSGNGDYNGASITIARDSGASAQDVFSGSGLLGTLTQGQAFTYNGTTVGSVTINSVGTLKLTFNASATSNIVDSVLQAIAYANSSDDPPANATLVWTFNDGTDDSTGTNQTTVWITPVNDAPTLTANGSSPTFTEGGSAVTLFSDAAANTVETSQALTGLTLTVSNVSNGASEVLSIGGTNVPLTATGGSPVAITGDGSAAVTLSGSTATITITGMTRDADQLKTLVEGITYSNSDQNPTTANRVVTITTLQDNGGTANSGADTATLSIASTVTVAAVNDVPVINDLSADAVSFSTGGSAVTLDSGTALTVTDPDNTTYASATVQITGNLQTGEDVLAFTNDGSTMGNITASYTASTGTLALSSAGATATKAQWEVALGAVTYSDSDANTVNTSARTLTWTVNDGSGNSSSVTSTVNLVRAPIIDLDTGDNGSGYSGSFTEGTPAAATGTTSISDDGTFKTLTVTLTNRPDGALESLSSTYGTGAQTVNGEAVTIGAYNSTTGVLSISVDDASTSAATMQLLMESIRYNNTSNNPDTTARSITFAATDNDDNTGATSTATLSVQGVNGAPTLSVGLDDTYNDLTWDGWIAPSNAANQSMTGTTLQLTPNDLGQFGGAMFDTAFASDQTMTVEFRYYSGGGNGADGISFFLVDGSATSFTLGSSGGALGYLPYGATPGLSGGWLAVGFDEYGGLFSNDGTNSAKGIALRGSASGDYQYVTRTPETSMGSNSVDGGYRRAKITLNPDNQLTVQWDYNDDGTYDYTPINLDLDSYAAEVSSRPASLKFGFSASTGARSNTHAIDWFKIGSASSTLPTLAYSENDGPKAITPLTLFATDTDSANLAGATVAISAHYQNGQDFLRFSDQNGITGSFDGDTGILTLSGNATIAQYQSALRSVAYENTSEDPNTSARSVTFKVNDGTADSNVLTASINVAAVNDNPVITSNLGGDTAAINVAENSTAVTTVTATDADAGQTVTYSLSGGADAAKFNIDANSGVLTFASAPNFEAPTDAGDTAGNNTYVVDVTAADGNGGTDVQTLTVTVTDVDETPPPPPPLPDPEPEPEPEPEPDADGIDDEVENAIPGLPSADSVTPVAGDGNGDGTPDSQQSDVTSVSFLQTPTAVSNPADAPTAFVSLVADSLDGKTDTTDSNSATLSNVRQLDAPADLPPEVNMPLGLISFSATVGTGTSGAAVTETFSLYVDTSLGVNGYWKLNSAGTWVNLASSVFGGAMVEEGGRLRLDFQLTDGGEFDADGKVDGTITDPGAAGSMPLSIVGYTPDLPEGGFWF